MMPLARRFGVIGLIACVGALLLGLAGCAVEGDDGFSIYLVSGETDPRKVDNSRLTDVALEKRPILREEDILHYELENHRLTLTKDAYDRLLTVFPLPIDVDGIPFVVAVDGELIYSGALYSSASSISYDGVVILQPLEEHSRDIELRLGYPCRTAFTGVDPRSDVRVLDRLEEINRSN